MRACVLFSLVVACGPPAASVSGTHAVSATPIATATATATVTPTATVVPAPSGKLRIALLGERKFAGDVRGIAFIATPELRLGVDVSGVLSMYTANLDPAQLAPHTWHPSDPLFVVGADAFDAKSGARHDVPIPSSLTCQAHAFSADGTRASAYCADAAGNDATYVYDAHTGAQLGVFKEFQTAAPVRSGTITQSGNFVFWASRASGAFEEIKSHVTGPAMSSHSVMSPDEHALFTTIDRTWFVGDTTPARMLDPKNGRELFTLPRDVETVVFSPSSRLFAALHSTRWADMEHAGPTPHTSVTIHSILGPDVLVRLPDADVSMIALAPGDDRVAVLKSGGAIRVYALEASPD